MILPVENIAPVNRSLTFKTDLKIKFKTSFQGLNYFKIKNKIFFNLHYVLYPISILKFMEFISY